MTIYIYVEGETEVDALPILLAHVYASRRVRNPTPLRGSRFLRDIGRAAAGLLFRKPDAQVFACPDLAPNDSYRNTPWAYDTREELQQVLEREVRRKLRARMSPRRAARAMRRFHPHPFCHDFEVVLLAWPERLKAYLNTEADITRHYHRQPEEQDFSEYPKRVVQRLFRQFARRRYNPVYDCPRILECTTPEDVNRIGELCPCFREFVEALRELVGP